MAEQEKQANRYPTDLTDAEWEIIRPFLPAQPQRGRKPTTEVRDYEKRLDVSEAMIQLAMASNLLRRLAP